MAFERENAAFLMGAKPRRSGNSPGGGGRGGVWGGGFFDKGRLARKGFRILASELL